MLLINFSLSSVLLLHRYKIIKYLKKQFHCLYSSMTLKHSNALITRHENIHTKITPPHYKTTLGNAHDCKNKIIKEQGLEFTMEKGGSILGWSLIHTSHKTSENQNNSLRGREERRYHWTIPTQILHFKVAQKALINTTHNLFSILFLSFNNFFRSADIFLSEACFFAWGPSWFDPSPLVSPLATFGPCK